MLWARVWYKKTTTTLSGLAYGNFGWCWRQTEHCLELKWRGFPAWAQTSVGDAHMSLLYSFPKEKANGEIISQKKASVKSCHVFLDVVLTDYVSLDEQNL